MLYTSTLQGNITILTATNRVTITPGASEMSDEEWAAIEDSPTVEGLLETQRLIPQQTKLKAKAKTVTTP